VIGLLLRAVGDAFRPPLLRFLWWSLGLTTLAAGLLIAGLWILLIETRVLETAWLETIADVLGGAAVVVLAVLLFPALLGLVSSVFLEDAANALERAVYPDAPKPRDVPLGESLAVALRFTGVLVGANLLALPVYLALAWLPPLNMALYVALNGYLLGREYYELVALRHHDAAALRAGFRALRARLFWAGVPLAILSLIPLLNLTSPLIATAFMVHLYRRFGGGRAAGANT
jgi:CysZ protein